MGATATVCQAGEQVPVSIHAPVWVRRQKDDIVLYRIGFNSRTRVGATPVPVILLISGLVSIHAPVWVRQANQNLQPINNMFQFTHPCGCDLATPSYVGSFSVFQFTHPCGCDGRSELSPGGTWSFNSRTRVGATSDEHKASNGEAVSIHAPVWVRQQLRGAFTMEEVFQFTHPGVCDDRAQGGGYGARSFNSRTRVGATSGGWLRGTFMVVSIHAPVWVRRQREHDAGPGGGFNSRTRVGATQRASGRQQPERFQFTHPCGCDFLEHIDIPDKNGFNSRTRVGATA